MDFTTTIQISQMIISELTGSAFVHKMQGQLFKSQGFNKLGDKYISHYTEEMGWVEKYTDRMLDLGVTPEVNVKNETISLMILKPTSKRISNCRRKELKNSTYYACPCG